MTEQKSTTTIEVLAPARRCVVSGWQPSGSPHCSGSADYCSSGVCLVTHRWSRTKSSPRSAYTLSARTTYRTNQLGPGVQ